MFIYARVVPDESADCFNVLLHELCLYNRVFPIYLNNLAKRLAKQTNETIQENKVHNNVDNIRT